MAGLSVIVVMNSRVQSGSVCGSFARYASVSDYVGTTSRNLYEASMNFVETASTAQEGYRATRRKPPQTDSSEADEEQSRRRSLHDCNARSGCRLLINFRVRLTRSRQRGRGT